ncbi:hypothetical protein [Flavobacterium piscis]|uniref:Uncharacterized protein n=1 Tax=Flavobacterium piscis TaxID=1114874 RepID=A0ABU1Y2I3_9FLAO|nr:hypothetical protein [Flavobacterium piscis]MDR7208427.1 hypothetical protein [Flavobacterium piscis]
MESYQFTTEKDFAKFQKTLSAKIRNGFVIIEQNDKLPYVVLSRKKKQIDPSFHLAMVFATLGLWSIIWFYQFITSHHKKDILMAVDEDGNVFEEKCLSR